MGILKLWGQRRYYRRVMMQDKEQTHRVRLSITRPVVCVWSGVRPWLFGTNYIAQKKSEDSARFPRSYFLSPKNTWAISQVGVRCRGRSIVLCVHTICPNKRFLSLTEQFLFQIKLITLCLLLYVVNWSNYNTYIPMKISQDYLKI